MKELSIEQMEVVSGGDWLNGLCGIGGVAGAAMGLRAVIGATVVLPGYGQVILGAVGVACGGRILGMWQSNKSVDFNYKFTFYEKSSKLFIDNIHFGIWDLPNGVFKWHI